MIGIPPPTLASKPTLRPFRRAASKISALWWARSALFAVTRCLPLSSNWSTADLAQSTPPTSSTATSIERSSITLFKLVVIRDSGIGTWRGL